MPSVAKTTPAEIVEAARTLIAREGLAGFSFQAVATAVGVQAPSLYKRFPDRGSLLRAVVHSVAMELGAGAEAAATTGSPSEDLRAIAHSQRAYAKTHPHLYALVFGPSHPDTELAPAEYGAMVVTLLDRFRVLVGPEQALSAARLLVSFTHGFSAMEAAGAFRLGADLDSDFEFGLDHVLHSLQRPYTDQRPLPLLPV